MIAKLWNLVQPAARPRFLLLVFVVMLGGFVELLGIGTVAEMMNLVATGGGEGVGGPLTQVFRLFSVTDPEGRLRTGLLVSISILASVHVYSALRSFLRSQFVWLQEKEISGRLFSTTLQRPYPWFLSRNSSELLHLLLSGGITQGLINSVLAALGQISVAGTLIVALIWVDPAVAAAGAVVVVLAYGAVRLATHELIHVKGAKAHYAEGQRRKVAQEALIGIRFVKTTGRERFFLSRFQQMSEDASKGMVYHGIYVDLVRAFLEWVSVAGILTLSVSLILQTKNFSELLPRLTLYTMATYRIIPAVHELFGLWSKLQFDALMLKGIEDLLDGPMLGQAVPAKKIEGLSDDLPLLQFEKVEFAYPGAERKILQGVDLRVVRREWIGIVGTTGTGKTTMLDLMSGLVEPTSGRVLVGSTLLSPEVTRDWQSRIGVVPQDVILLDETLLANVAFGLSSEQVDLERVTQVCLAAGLDELIANLPHKFQTALGERGVRLSGGERQRVGIARALYSRPDLLLLDEATSALDQATEARIVKTLRDLANTCTLITVAHRLSSVRPCDRILVMENGKIAAEGTYDQLIQGNETFQNLALVSR